jgi:hypothetical protein
MELRPFYTMPDPDNPVRIFSHLTMLRMPSPGFAGAVKLV